MTLHQPNLFGINVGTNTVFSLQTVAIPSSGNPYTVAPVLHNHIRLLFSSTRSLFVLLFHFKLIQSEAIQELRSATVFSCLFLFFDSRILLCSQYLPTIFLQGQY